MHTQPHLPPLIELAPAHRFTRYPTNRQPTGEALATMVDSIRSIGVLQHVLARPITSPDGEITLQLIFGETRWRACHTIAVDYPVPVHIQPMDDRQAARLHAAENFQRQDLNEIEKAREIQHLQQVGWTIEEIMQQLGGVSKPWIYRRLSLLQLPEPAQAALISRDISVQTAAAIASLPEESRIPALTACIQPAHSIAALTERQALEVIQKKFIQPLEQASEWEKNKRHLLDMHPACTWLDYAAASTAAGFQSPYELATSTPSPYLLSDAARAGELIVPTWEQLASVHRAPVYIGLDAQHKTTLYVIPEPIIAAEIAAHDSTPGDCIFTHESAVKQNRDHAEKRKHEQTQQAAALHAQKLTLARRLVADEDLPPAEFSTLAQAAFLDAASYLENLPAILNLADDQEILKFPLPARPFDFLGRLHYAAAILEMSEGEFQNMP